MVENYESIVVKGLYEFFVLNNKNFKSENSEMNCTYLDIFGS